MSTSTFVQFASIESLEPRLLLSGSLPGAGEPVEWETSDGLREAVAAWSEKYGDPRVYYGLRDLQWSIAEAVEDADAGDLSCFSTQDIPVDAAGNVKVEVHFDELDQDVISALDAAHLTVVEADSGGRAVTGWVPYDAIDALLEVQGIWSIRPVVRGVTNRGDAGSAGDAIEAAAAVRNQLASLGLDGSGVKIGVISDGVDHIAASQATGDLPDGVQVNSSAQGKDEGTAMLEIIHDIAPAASLYFSSGTVSMLGSITWLESQGCDIIVDDLTWFDEPYFEDGQLADAVSDAVSDGIVYITSAGNWAPNHYQGDANPDANGWHRFSGADNTQNVLLANNETLYAYLQWSDAFGGSGNDYDLYLFDGSQQELASSRSQQGGSGDPFEWFHWTNNTGNSVWVYVAVDCGTADGRELELFTMNRTSQQYTTQQDSIIEHAAVTDVITVGAADASSPDAVEGFMSRGPSTIYTDFGSQTSIQRHPLDGIAIDGIETTVGQADYFNNPFYGTSAAAPHVAGIAALMLEADPTLTPAQVSAILQDTAIDMGDAGYDDTSGYGRFDALNAVQRALGACAHWKLDEGSGTTVRDSTGLGNDTALSAYGMAWTTNAITGGAALDLPGTSISDYMAVADDDTLDASSAVTVSAWVYVDELNSGDNNWILFKDSQYAFDLQGGFPRWEVYVDGGWRSSPACASISLNAWHHVAGTYDSTTHQIRIYVDGELWSSETLTGLNQWTVNQSNNELRIGARGGACSIDGRLDDVRLDASILGQDELRRIVARAGAGLEMFEGGGTVVSDSAGGENVGVATGPDWTSNGQSGGCALDFAGGSDYVSVPDVPSLNPTAGITVSAWVYADQFRSGTDNWVLYKNNQYHLDFNNSAVRFGVYVDGAWRYGDCPTVSDQTWHHIACTYDAATHGMSVYVDGSQCASNVLTGLNGWTIGQGTSSALRIGYPGWANAVDGVVDDVSIYGRSLSPTEIAGVVANPAADFQFDEGSGTITRDSSGNSHQGAITGASWTANSQSGGEALAFDADGEVVTVQNEPSLNPTKAISVAGWVYVDALHAGDPGQDWILYKNNQYSLDIWGNGTPRFLVYVDSSFRGTISGANLSLDTWHHVAGTYDADAKHVKVYIDGALVGDQALPELNSYDIATGTSDLLIGDPGWTTPLNGILDGMQVYRRALSAEEVAELADNPVGHWMCDEQAGPVIADSAASGAGDGTLSNVSRTSGRVQGRALLFDGSGTSDTATVADAVALNPTSAVTFATWVYADANNSGADQDWVAYKHNQYALHLLDDTLDPRFEVYVDGGFRAVWGNVGLSLDSWHHLAGTYDSTTHALKLYIDGTLAASTTLSGLSGYSLGAGNGSALKLGAPGWVNPVNGALDDVRVYNRPLGSSEIARLAAFPVEIDMTPCGANQSSYSVVEGSPAAARAAVGSYAYGDTGTTITDLPAFLAGRAYVKTASADVQVSAGTTQLQLTVGAPSMVYVAYDTDIANKPSWLTTTIGAVDSGWNLTTSSSTFDVFCKFIAADTAVTFGGNAGGANDQMYFVLVAPAA